MTRHAWLLLLAAAFLRPGDEERDQALRTITEEECAARVRVLAAPEMEGRATLSEGLERAARYVEEELAALGLEPAGADGTFRLPYEIPCVVAAEDAAAAWIAPDHARHDLERGRDFVPLPASAEGTAEGEAVFAGYAIDADNEHWRDLEPPKVKGKVVFAFTREPRADDPKSGRFGGAEPTLHSTLGQKVRAAAAAGASALLLVADPALGLDAARPLPELLPFPVPAEWTAERLAEAAGWPRIPVASVSRAVAEAVFGEDLAAYQKSLDRRMRPRLLAAPKGTRVELAVRLAARKVPAFNVAARLRGSDGDGEAVVLGAHLDHVGWAYGQDQGRMRVHPGGDDNGSGIAALLEVAQALAATKPKEDLLFLWFTGEELGLLGSRAYCENPLVPAEKSIVMMNMDMVGRGEARKVVVGGLWDRPEWEKLVRRQARAIRSDLELELEQGRDLYTRSDQYSFHEEGVPALFFFEGDLEQNRSYHRPDDVPETLDAAKMARIARFFCSVAYAVACEGERP